MERVGKNIKGMFQNKKLLRVLLCLAFLCLPLLVSSHFVSYFSLIKWQIVYLIAFGGVLYYLLKQEIKLPQFPRPIQYLLIGLLGIAFVNYFIQGIPFLSEVTLDRLSFIFLALIFYNLFKEEKEFFDHLSLIISLSAGLFLSAYGLSTLIGFNFVEQKETATAFTFGNNNMAAEFIGLSILFQTYSLSKKHTKQLQGILLAIFIFSIMYIALTGSRSITLSLGVAGFVYFLLQRERIGKKGAKIVVTFLLLSIVFMGQNFGWSKLTGSSDPYVQGQVSTSGLPEKGGMKSFAIQQRLGLWESTLRMLKDHPFGVGQDRFGFYVTPYKKDSEVLSNFKYNIKDPYLYESSLEKTPHNEYLRFLAEDGIPFFIVLSLLLSYLAWLAFSNRTSRKTRDFLITFFIFLATQSFFQFPLLNPISFLIISMMSGQLFAYLFEERVYSHRFYVKSLVPGIYGALFLTRAIAFQICRIRDLRKSSDQAACKNFTLFDPFDLSALMMFSAHRLNRAKFLGA